jgi:hypothetical protein
LPCAKGDINRLTIDAGLLQSKRLTIDALRHIAESLSIKLPEKTTRQQWIDEIVKVASRRIDKQIHELFEMDEQALLDYFERIEVEPSELLDILKELDVRPAVRGVAVYWSLQLENSARRDVSCG